VHHPFSRLEAEKIIKANYQTLLFQLLTEGGGSKDKKMLTRGAPDKLNSYNRGYG